MVNFKYSNSSFSDFMPKTYLFDDLGAENNLKYYGNDYNVIAEILLSRYDLFISQKMITHITTTSIAKKLTDVWATSTFRDEGNVQFVLV